MNNKGNGSIGFFGLLAVALIVLKLLGYISIAWGWIIIILAAPLILIFGFLLVMAIIVILKG